MDRPNALAKLRYQGYANTPLLWAGNSVQDLKQFSIDHASINSIHQLDLAKRRLGHQVEQFVFNDLKNDPSIHLLASNIQIDQSKITIGELDALLLKSGLPIHLEVVFKFYLYDPHTGATPMEHWIGANRKDSLVQKLEKLEQHQLPLLFHEKTQMLLNKWQLNANEFEQFVYFKAQLFLPFSKYNEVQSEAILNESQLNKECLSGYYIHYQELNTFENCQFYIPKKIDWLMDVHPNVDWRNHMQIMEDMEGFMKKQRSSLCWIRFPDGRIEKMFVVWW